MPDDSQLQCRNCFQTQKEAFDFCPNCGQKNTDGKITFGEIRTEFMDAVFNIESRTWQTLKALFVPGKLTLEYFEGRHRSYVHPLRLLLVTSLLVILAMSFHDVQSYTNHSFVIKDELLKSYEHQRVTKILRNAKKLTNREFSDSTSIQATDTLMRIYYDSLRQLRHRFSGRYRDSVDLSHYLDFYGDARDMVSKHDFFTMSEEELTNHYQIKGAFNRMLFQQKAKYIKDESVLATSMLGLTTWAILLMMPCLAMILYLLYIKHPYYYIEHLIFSFHTHSFSFIIIAIMIAGWFSFPGWLLWLLTLIMAIYLYLALLRVYKQKKGKTFMKFIVLNLIYLFLFIFFLFGTFLVSLLLF